MKKPLSILAVLLVAGLALGQGLLAKKQSVGSLNQAAPATGGGGGSPVNLSDNFNRASSTDLGADWTEAEGAWMVYDDTILTNEAEENAWVAAVHNTAVNTVFQYGKVLLTDGNMTVGNNGAAGFVFRYTDAASAFYTLSANSYDDTVKWNYVSDANFTTETLVQSSALAFASGDTIGAVVVGSGNSTIVYVWKNPTGNSPDAGGTTWGSASPTLTLTDNPSTAVNSGSKVGLAMYADVVRVWNLDNWFSGDVTP